jgi:hypothetical protein
MLAELMLSVTNKHLIMLSVIMLNVVVLSVVAPQSSMHTNNSTDFATAGKHCRTEHAKPIE